MKRFLAGLACVVAVDTGHHAEDSGAISARGVPEHTYNRLLADSVTAALIADGVAVIPTNPSLGKIGLYDRPLQPNGARADLFLSLHHDSVYEGALRSWTYQGQPHRYSDDYGGFSVFVSAKNPEFEKSQAFAAAIARRLLADGLRPALHHAGKRPLLDPMLGLYRYDDLVVLKASLMPAVLLEGGVIVNRPEETLIATDGFREMAARAVAAAVREQCGR